MIFHSKIASLLKLDPRKGWTLRWHKFSIYMIKAENTAVTLMSLAFCCHCKKLYLHQWLEVLLHLLLNIIQLCSRQPLLKTKTKSVSLRHSFSLMAKQCEIICWSSFPGHFVTWLTSADWKGCKAALGCALIIITRRIREIFLKKLLLKRDFDYFNDPVCNTCLQIVSAQLRKQ